MSTTTLKFPYLIVRVVSAVYQREEINVRVGPTALAQIGNACCSVVHPTPFLDDGAISSACRRFMVRTVQDAMRPTKFRTCLVWAPGDCTYIEADSSIDSSEPPSGGIDFDLPANPRLVVSLSAASGDDIGSPSVTH